jgi:hypothetical protein
MRIRRATLTNSVCHPVNSVALVSMTSLSGIPTSSVKSTKDFSASFLEGIGTTLVNSPFAYTLAHVFPSFEWAFR